MAAPIAHIFLAVQMLSGPLENKFNLNEFLAGTSFPDIRYLKCAEREETHFNNVTLDDIKKETNSFRAGMLFHSLVDEKREEYIVKNHIYEKLPDFRFITQSLKFAEDKILMSLFDIKQYQYPFNKIYDEERSHKISVLNIKKWHDFLKGYFNKEFSTHDLVMKYFDLHDPEAWKIKRLVFSWFYARKINNTIEAIIRDKNIKELLLNFYLNFSKIY